CARCDPPKTISTCFSFAAVQTAMGPPDREFMKSSEIGPVSGCSRREIEAKAHECALAFCLGMILFGKPLHTFPDHALEGGPTPSAGRLSRDHGRSETAGGGPRAGRGARWHEAGARYRLDGQAFCRPPGRKGACGHESGGGADVGS